jgi:polysaccharide biosynthesis/export protein
MNNLYRILKIYLICLLFVSTTGCFAKRPTQMQQTGEVAVNIPKDLNSGEKYKINPFDVLDISVFQEPDLSKTVRVSQDGFITFPLIGKVAVAGLDVMGAEDKIAGLLEKDYLISPNVNILVKEYNIKKISVMGAVKTPGSYEIPQNRTLTVLESIALAGGFSNVAAQNSTKVIRVENGKQQYIEVKVSDITARGDKSKDIFLMPNDIVFVPERVF